MQMFRLKPNVLVLFKLAECKNITLKYQCYYQFSMKINIYKSKLVNTNSIFTPSDI